MNKEIVIPILNDEYKVVVCWGDQKFIKKVLKDWCHDPSVDTSFDGLRGKIFYSKQCAPIIALPKKPKTAEQLGTLAHEATHAVVDIFETIGEDVYHEVFAHSVGAIVRSTLKKDRK